MNYYIVKTEMGSEKFFNRAEAVRRYTNLKNNKKVFCGWFYDVEETKKFFGKRVRKFVIANFWNM